MKYFITLANFCISTKRKLHKVPLVYCRCIHDSQRTFALGIQWCIARLLGTSFLFAVNYNSSFDSPHFPYLKVVIFNFFFFRKL